MVFTARFAGGKGGRNGFENELRRLGVKQKNGRPNHPQTQGKVRAALADPEEMAGRPDPPARHPRRAADPARRLHQLLQPAPAAPLPAAPANPRRRVRRPAQGRPRRPHRRHPRPVRTDIIGPTGTVTLRHRRQLYHIGVGRTHARTHVIMLMQDLDIRIIDAATGELIRELTLDPAATTSPPDVPPDPRQEPRERQNPEP